MGEGPTALETAWSGPWRYGICGPLVAYLDQQLGRLEFTRLLGATTNAEILDAVGSTEAQWLATWASEIEAAAQG